jgi:lysophospholipase L1-like esterase
MERRLRHESWFKRLILGATSVMIVLVMGILPRGRYMSASLPAMARGTLRRATGGSRSRAEIDDEWRRFRQFGIETTRTRAARAYADADPAYQRLTRYAGMDPEHMLVRWGNYDWTMIFPSKVFEVDNAGRSYRFLPLVRSVWLLDVPSVPDGPTFFLVPDGPGLAEAIAGTKARPLLSSRQSTNSWGLRGPEPDLTATVRGIVLGDSFMQGMFIGDAQSPPSCLQSYLRYQTKTEVSILNTGVMGYSPEQYYYTLIEFAERFRPHFVVVSICVNDFGDIRAVFTTGNGDWEEGKYWLEKIVRYCRQRGWPCLIVPAPLAAHLTAKRNSGHYPGPLTDILEIGSLEYYYPIEEFANALLTLTNGAKHRGVGGLIYCPLFNDELGDHHFSPIGSEVWARAVGRRLLLLLDRDPAPAEQQPPVAGER